MARLSPRLFPGAVELVTSLAARVRLAVVADARRELVEAVLNGHGLLDQIELIIAADDVKATRPAPDGLRLAVKRLKLKPNPIPTTGGVLTVEGTPAGLRAARLAKISALAVGHRRPFDDWVGDAPYVSGLEPVAGLLAQLGFPSEP